MHGQVIAMFQIGGEVALHLHHLVPLRHQKKFPSFNTCMQWVRHHQIDGHSQSKRPIGNHHAEHVIKGQDILNLALFQEIGTKAYIGKVRSFIRSKNPANDPYSPSQVAYAEQRLGLCLEDASTTSDCA